jgi:transcriptional regulator with XRE-family HTH domain
MNTIHDRLSGARERKGWTQEALARRIGVREPVLALIEQGAFGELPTGLYGRYAVRAYASAVGLDPVEVLEAVAPLLRTAEDPLDGLARVRGFGRRPRSARDEEVRRCIPQPAPCRAPTIDWRPMVASAIDGMLLFTIGLIMVQLTAIAAGVTAGEALVIAGPVLFGVFTLIFVLYFLALGGLGHATIGAYVVHADPLDEPHGPIDAREAVRRATNCALRESSIIVEWLISTEQGQHCLRAFRRV